MVALAGFAGKRVTPVRRLGAAACEGELLRRNLRKTSARDRCLTVGDAAVVDGHSMGDQDGKTGVFEFVGKELKQKSVHEHTAESATVSRFSRLQISHAMWVVACVMAM